ncbi:MAG: glutamate synthase large subunit [Spirochaetes bacterium]|nr:MAG: glutamate synthase large subunit [Spirochaetota bacterium]
MRKPFGLYDPSFEHDACGVGFVVNINGEATHQIVRDGVTIILNLEHRGAVGGDATTGDGAGILVQVPHRFFVKIAGENGFTLPEPGNYGVGMMFLPMDDERRARALGIIGDVAGREGAHILGTRDVPVSADCLGELARGTMPHIVQVFVQIPGIAGDTLERKLYVLRRRMENTARSNGFSPDDFYAASFSSRTVVYKGMFVAPQLSAFYPDLSDPDFTSALALVHQRYSTNTFPSWPLAQPFRYLAHNGEINTLRGNINKMRARESMLESPLFGNDIQKIKPIIDESGSDSAIFDNAFELLCMGGRAVEHSMMMMVPEAWGVKYHMSQDKRAFYEYNAAIMEPWDGPAAMAFSDGIRIGATLDRNGLRPARFVVTRSGQVVVASEVGVLDFPPEDVLQYGRLAPGKMILVDTLTKRVMYNNEIKARVSRQKPYRRWVESNRIDLKGLYQVPSPIKLEPEELFIHERVFGFTLEERGMIIAPMAETGQEPVGSMGNDQALPVLSNRPQLLYSYFKQLFAQVTNPPIDPYRENLVMSLMSFIGQERNLLDETPEHVRQVKLPHPVLSNDDIAKMKNLEKPGLLARTIQILVEMKRGRYDFEEAFANVCVLAENAVDEGIAFIILSDREVCPHKVPIPALLAVSAIHHHLVKCGKRTRTGLIVETGDVRDVNQFALLVGYGASAVNPYMALEVVTDLHRNGHFSPSLTLEAVIDNYITAQKKGLLKIMSKMGVATIRSYRGAQIFEAVGLNTAFLNRYFPGTPGRIEGIGLEKIAEDACARHESAFAPNAIRGNTIDSGGAIHLRARSEKHQLTARAIVALLKAVREGDYRRFKSYSAEMNNAGENLCTLRGLFTFKPAVPIPLDQVESEEKIISRFVTGAMSFGSISREAHETIAIAMNRLGANSNSGEGGEDEARYLPLPNGDSSRSMVKQVASGRFGVTSNYLVNSREIQIKMAQGAKPGEGGQLPGHKVDVTIARVRYSTPGVMLISPPPHHDIYSIEDLAQLIYDLKNANPAARVSVKLVSEIGVGTVAAGVAKAKADTVLISGHDGGTGASPISSIKHAGSPWEIGLAETQQTLMLNHLRDKIRVQVDGQMRTGRDVVVAALLGAEEYGFGTITLVTLGCIMMRKCHLNTCPVGIATQDPRLRARFKGAPEHVMNFMRFIAREVREYMAELGFRTMDEMIGRADMLDMNAALDYYAGRGLDFSKLFAVPGNGKELLRRCTSAPVIQRSVIDEELLAETADAIETKRPVRIEKKIRNSNRTVGAMLSSRVSLRYGSAGLPDETIRVKFRGSAGQSFGAFLARGITLELEGNANDYFGKGLSGGRLVVYPDRAATFRPESNIITGNVNLFGATAGEAFINGMAGERFAVRNSGAVAVVEGLGDHGCEYMTGGIVTVLGKTGVNFAAGMSGGVAYVLDEDQLFDTNCNLEMVDIEPVSSPEDMGTLRALIERHVEHTGSRYATRILEEWDAMLPQFVKVMPIDYRKALERIRKEERRDTENVLVTEEVFA